MSTSLRTAVRMVMFSFGGGFTQFSGPRRLSAFFFGLTTFTCLGAAIGFLLAATLDGEGLAAERVRLIALLSAAGITALMGLLVVAVAELVDKRAIEGELAAAAQIQQRLMPKEELQVPGYALNAFQLPAKAVGGDLYDYRRYGNQLLVVVADVSGKGLAAAIVMAGVRNRIRAVANPMTPLPELVANLNRAIFEDTSPSRYVTLALVRLALESGSIEYVSAGHVPPPLISGPDGPRWLEPTGMPVGLFVDATYRSGKARLATGETLVLVTDGVTEAENRRGEEFGMDRLAAAMQAMPPGADATAGLRSAVRQFAGSIEPHDDLTIVTVAHEA